MAKPKQKSEETASTFEEDLEQLEAIVNALEEGGLTLDESLKRFEDGIQLARRCEKALTETERRIEVLLKNADGELETQPFDESATAAPARPAARAKAPARPATAVEEDPDHEPEPEEEEEDGELLF